MRSTDVAGAPLLVRWGLTAKLFAILILLAGVVPEDVWRSFWGAGESGGGGSPLPVPAI
jgi:hypothetical protein